MMMEYCLPGCIPYGLGAKKAKIQVEKKAKGFLDAHTADQTRLTCILLVGDEVESIYM